VYSIRVHRRDLKIADFIGISNRKSLLFRKMTPEQSEKTVFFDVFERTQFMLHRKKEQSEK
jgi:hypothetical protein